MDKTAEFASPHIEQRQIQNKHAAGSKRDTLEYIIMVFP